MDDVLFRRFQLPLMLAIEPMLSYKYDFIIIQSIANVFRKSLFFEYRIQIILTLPFPHFAPDKSKKKIQIISNFQVEKIQLVKTKSFQFLPF